VIKKIGIDIHGVITDSPEFWKSCAQIYLDRGSEVHIITGAEFKKVKDILKDFPYTHFFSISEYHKDRGIEVTYNEKGDPHMDDEIWNKTKAIYCKENNIDIHIDDSDIYGKYFTGRTQYIKL